MALGGLDTLIRLVPEEGEKILVTSNQLLSEFSEPENMLSGRNFARLQMLLDSIEEWKNSDTLENNTIPGLENVYSEIHSVCSKENLSDENAEHCAEIATAYALIF